MGKANGMALLLCMALHSLVVFTCKLTIGTDRGSREKGGKRSGAVSSLKGGFVIN